jgi:DNA-binding response OmpR family regulator
MKFLIIESDAEDFKQIMNAFDEYFPDVGITTDTGIRYMEIIKKNKPDLIVVDSGLSGKNYLDVIKRIRECSQIPIIALCGRNVVESVAALETGTSSCISKPIRNHEFAARIKVLLKRK